MRQKTETRATPEQIVTDIRRATRKHHSDEEKIRILLEGLRGEYSIAGFCRREGIAESLYWSWSKDARNATLASANLSVSPVKLGPESGAAGPVIAPHNAVLPEERATRQLRGRKNPYLFA